MRIFLLSSKTHNVQGIYNLQIFQAFLLYFFSRGNYSPLRRSLCSRHLPSLCEWRSLVQGKTHSAPGNGCCGLMNPHRQSAFVGLRLAGLWFLPVGSLNEFNFKILFLYYFLVCMYGSKKVPKSFLSCAALNGVCP